MGTLLFVCQANVLRSPSAEALAAAMLAEAGADTGWDVASAGVEALVGSPIEPAAAAALAARQIVAAGHRARQLTPAMLQDADLVVTFESWQRAWAVRQMPRKVRSIVTIRRAAHLLAAVPEHSTGLDHVLSNGARRYGPDDDFADPIGAGPREIAAAVDEIDDLVRTIIPPLVGLP